MRVAFYEFSAAQANYVALRHPENPRAPIFYKDATPRAEHYVRCGVRVEEHIRDVPRAHRGGVADGVHRNCRGAQLSCPGSMAIAMMPLGTRSSRNIRNGR